MRHDQRTTSAQCVKRRSITWHLYLEGRQEQERTSPELRFVVAGGNDSSRLNMDLPKSEIVHIRSPLTLPVSITSDEVQVILLVAARWSG
jgi:predicted PP-loop superfamily ATPase